MEPAVKTCVGKREGRKNTPTQSSPHVHSKADGKEKEKKEHHQSDEDKNQAGFYSYSY